MKQKHMEVLREIQAICEEEIKGGCSNSCPFYDDGGCLFVLYPKYWEWNKFKVEDTLIENQENKQDNNND